MDEVDGVVGTSDRGGLSALLAVIKKTLIPIVCIANDSGNRKIQTLKNHSYELKFAKPSLADISKLTGVIARKEGCELDSDTARYVAEVSGQDIRQVINIMQMWTTTERAMCISQGSKRIDSLKKDQVKMLNVFQAAQKLLNSKDAKLLSF